MKNGKEQKKPKRSNLEAGGPAEGIVERSEKKGSTPETWFAPK